MKEEELLQLPMIRLNEDDFTVEFEIEVANSLQDLDTISEEEIINDGISSIDEQLMFNQKRIDEINQQVDRLTNHADGIDYMVAVGSGVITGLIDAFFVGEFSMDEGKKWSNEKVNRFVEKVAKKDGYDGDGRLKGAINHLEKKHKIPSDNTWSGKDAGISAKSHRLDDLAHHPTPIGLFSSIVTQFTKKAYFQNSKGSFFDWEVEVKEKSIELIGDTFPKKIFAGTINWFLHLVSDISGTNKNPGAGMGIPGPILSMAKEFSSLPGVKNSGLPQKINDAFVKERFDFRSELAVAHQLKKQAMPVILNEIIVRSFYFIRRLVIEIKEKKDIHSIEWKKTLPWKNRTIARMLTIATGTFTAIDLCDAAIRGGLKSAGNPPMFAKEFILNVNFVGVGRFAVAVGTDVSMGIKKENLRNERIGIISEQLHLRNSKIFYLQAGTWVAAETTEQTINEAIDMMEQTTVIAINAWEANRKSMKNISEFAIGIQENNNDILDDLDDIFKWG